MGMGPTATVGFLDEDGKWTPVSATNSLPTTGGGGGGGGTDLTSYTQVSSLPDYPTEFPPDVSSISPEDIGAQPAGSYATAAQGALADTAVQPGDLATVATTGAYADLTGQPDIPTTAQDVGALPDTTTPGDIGAAVEGISGLPAGSCLNVYWDDVAGEWPAAPTTRSDITIFYHGGTSANPPDLREPIDVWIKSVEV